ncbi:phosphoglycerate mutase [Curvibacter sp. RS43]|uniref:phosphoglycerate mutase n=1 Tax=Curvibacter microcysteis TaxID=3026419 RepID=UPI002361C7F9|nr:phosphoglycerate mutase [Curvibacter sp. RS43]MDD0811853.1 phosphoglycerate mutase [Curvibacter sp. RS43]
MPDLKTAPAAGAPATRALIVPYAGAGPEAAQSALNTLALPQLDRLLQRLQPEAPDEGDEYHYIPPHERALARALGLPDGQGGAGDPPWAAQRAQQRGLDTEQAWAWLSPSHWLIGADQIQMGAPSELGLDAAEAQRLIDVLAPFFAEDGIQLHLDTPDRWLASGEVFRGLHSAALDRVLRRDIQAWLPEGPGARSLRRLQSETQMLLYTHPLSEARSAARQPVVNSFWVSGSGTLPAGWQAPLQTPEVLEDLRQPALDGNWAAWAQAWQAMDSGPVHELLKAAEAGQTVSLTLCGERSARHWRSSTRSLSQRLRGWISRPLSKPWLEAL